MRFLRVRLENWRNFQHANVTLQNRVFLVGQNASGKSNFLDVFRFLRDIADTNGGGFQRAVNIRGGVSALRWMSARQKTDIVVDVEIGDDIAQPEWRYRIEFNQQSTSVRLKEETVWRQGEKILTRPNRDDKDDVERLSQTYLEQTFANKSYRDVADFFESTSYLHLVPQLVRDPERYTGAPADPYGSDFLEQLAKVGKRSQSARLRRIRDAVKSAIPQMSELEWIRDKQGIPHLRGLYDNWRGRGVWQQETEFSDGTLRLIGLLWALQSGEGPLLLEEPELSLHPGVVRQLPTMMRDVQRDMKRSYRQILMSTHSTELLQDESIALDEVLLLLVDNEGTKIVVGADDETIVNQMNAGFTVADAVLPKTIPQQLTLL